MSPSVRASTCSIRRVKESRSSSCAAAASVSGMQPRLIAQRAALGVSQIAGEDQDRVDQRPDPPQRANRHHSDHNLQDAEGRVSQKEAADAESAEEKAQQSCRDLALVRQRTPVLVDAPQRARVSARRRVRCWLSLIRLRWICPARRRSVLTLRLLIGVFGAVRRLRRIHKEMMSQASPGVHRTNI